MSSGQRNLEGDDYRTQLLRVIDEGPTAGDDQTGQPFAIQDEQPEASGEPQFSDETVAGEDVQSGPAASTQFVDYAPMLR